MAGASAILDDVFVEIGEIGRNQIVVFALLIVLNILSGTSTINYMISAGNLDYRWVLCFLHQKNKMKKKNKTKWRNKNPN